MDLIDFCKYVVIPLLLAYIGFNEKDKRMIKKTLEKTAPKNEVEKLIDLKMQIHQVEIREMKGDLARIESKLDRLIDKFTK